MAIYNLFRVIMKNKTQQERLFNFGISFLALGAFPLVWFLSQAILFREYISREIQVKFSLLMNDPSIIALFLRQFVNDWELLLLAQYSSKDEVIADKIEWLLKRVVFMWKIELLRNLSIFPLASSHKV